MNQDPNKESRTHTEEALTDILTSKTPFRLEEGWEMATDNKNASCSHAEIDTLVQKRILNLVDLEIMKILASFHYLNHRTLRLELERRLHPGYQKDSYSDNLRKMKRAGLLLCFLPVQAGNASSADPPAPASPLRLYCLSTAAFTYTEQLTEAHPIRPSSVRRKIELAASGQFLVQFLQHHGESVIGYEYEKGAKVGNTLLLLDAVIRYRASVPEPAGEQTATLFLLALRRHRNWEKASLDRLKLFRVWLSRHEYPMPFSVLAVEDIAMALELYAGIQEAEVLSGFSVFFCPDSLLMAVPPLQALYRCEADDGGKVTAVRVDLTGNIYSE